MDDRQKNREGYDRQRDMTGNAQKDRYRWTNIHTDRQIDVMTDRQI